MRMMPLPRFDPADARTSTWGGTMIGIPRHAKDPDASWKLIEFLYLSDAGVDARVAQSTILPPLPEHFDRPEYQQPDPYFGGQKVDALYAELAEEIPPRYMSPLTIGAQTAISLTLARATDYIRERGTEGLEAKCAEWLANAEQDLLRRLAHAEYGG
jgi:ABC-type glycerol-3-phosphate transport system substrate-binding protein